MEGYGHYTWFDGSVYEGEFIDGQPKGHGKITKGKTGKTLSGIFDGVDLIIDSRYGPDHYVMNKVTSVGINHLDAVCSDGRT